MKNSTNFCITNHAAEQFCTRTNQFVLASQARKYLINQINEQVYKLEQKTRHGQTQWHVPTANCILITKYERNKHVVVTTISDDSVKQNFVLSEIELLNRLHKFDTYHLVDEIKQPTKPSSLEEDLKTKIISLIQSNKSETIKRLSSRRVVHKCLVEGQEYVVQYNKDSKRLDFV